MTGANAMTPDDFRRLALGLEGASEGSHHGTADFRANGRIFATLGWPDAGWGVVLLTPDEQAMRVEAAPETFSPVPGGWGRRGHSRVHLPKADEAAVRGALSAAWAVQVAKPAARKRKA